jgi:CheY-like chemotaxis protein
MDINMPIMDGLEATSQLKSLMGAGQIQSIPIIALTAYDEMESCFKIGMDGFLQKPVKRDEIMLTLEKCGITI